MQFSMGEKEPQYIDVMSHNTAELEPQTETMDIVQVCFLSSFEYSLFCPSQKTDEFLTGFRIL